MAFNAGAIEATLTLNRNPFTAGLAAARTQARSFAREKYEATASVKIDANGLGQVKAQLRALAKESRTALARVIVDRLKFDTLRRDLREFGRQTYTATARVDVADSNSQLRGLINLLNRSGQAANSNRRQFNRFGNDSRRTFQGMDHDVRMVVGALPLLLPVAGAAINGTVGLVGALTAALATAAVGVGAFGLVAIPTFSKVFDAVSAGRKEIDKLPPGMRQAANATVRLRDTYNELVKATQTRVGFAMAAGFDAARAAIRPLAPLANTTARALEDIGRQIERYFATDTHWRDFLDLMTRSVGPVLQLMADAVFLLTRGVMNLVTAFMPLGQWLLERIVVGMEKFVLWTERLVSGEGFGDWVERARSSLIALWNFISSLTEFIMRTADALSPLGNRILDFFTRVFRGLNSLPPEHLAAVAMGLSSIFAAMMLGASGPVALAIGAIAGMSAALNYLYDTNVKVHQSIDKMYESLRQRFVPIWDKMEDNFRTKIIPVWSELFRLYRDDIGPVIEKLANLFVEKVIPRLEAIADTITGKLIPSIGNFLIAVEPFVKFFLETVGVLFIDALDKLGYTFDQALKVMADIFDAFAAAFRGDWTTYWEEVNSIFKNAVTDPAPVLFGEMWNSFLRALQEEGQMLEEDWKGLWTRTTMASREEWDLQVEGMRNTWERMKMLNREGGQALLNDWNTWLDSLTTDFNEEVAIWQNLWHRFWTMLKDEWNREFEELRQTVNDAKEKLGQAWRDIANRFRDPINWVIRVVINRGILDSWNTVMGWIGAERLRAAPMPEIPMFAHGGVLPGYAPGRDSLLIGASPGESLLRPEVTRAVGPGWINQVNLLARTGGLDAVKRFLAFGGEGFQQFALGGIVAGQNFARSQAGKPYVWGGVGPGGYDCSGFISAVTNAALGLYPHARRFATGSFGPGRGAGGFLPGTNSAFVIGVSPNTGSGIGHMAGNIGGLNIESRGGDGVVLGGSARGPQSSLFPWHFYLPQAGGFFQPAPYSEGGGFLSRIVSWWSVLAGRVTSLFDGLLNFSGMPSYGSPIGNAITNIPRNLVGRVKDTLKGKLENVFTLSLDEGGYIPTGYSLIHNGTGKPEPAGHQLLEGRSDEEIEKIVRSIVREVQPLWGNLIVQTGPQATAKQIIDEATFKSRAARRLGAHR